MECVRLLNEIWCEFDLMLKSTYPDGTLCFPGVEKIKTVSSSYTYIVAAGLSADGSSSDSEDMGTRVACPAAGLVKLAGALQEKLGEVSGSCFYDFQLRVGVHEGPLVSGVIGAKKPLFDIFGDTVNIASRMDTTGEAGKIQVVEDVARKLETFGYSRHSRGEIEVKGKGPMATAFVVVPPNQHWSEPTQ